MSNWNEFEIRIAVNAPIPSVYACWATSGGIERWFLRKAVFTARNGTRRLAGEPYERGDRYHWLWHAYGDDVFEANRILAANGDDFVQFEFTGRCAVSVRLEHTQALTMVTLRQERIPDDPDPTTSLFVNCQLGWTFYLTNLKSVLEGGLDLRNREAGLMPVLNA